MPFRKANCNRRQETTEWFSYYPGQPFLYQLNVWVSENSFCLYQKKIQDKSNEITAIPDTLDTIDITGATVSIDAMGTQREVADLIVYKKGGGTISMP